MKQRVSKSGLAESGIGPIFTLMRQDMTGAFISVAGPLFVAWFFTVIRTKTLLPPPIASLDFYDCAVFFVTFLGTGIWWLRKIDIRLRPFKSVLAELYNHEHLEPALKGAAIEYLKDYTHNLFTGISGIGSKVHALWEIEFLRTLPVRDTDVRSTVRERVESLCNRLACSGQIESYFATEDIVPHELDAFHTDWWQRHREALQSSGIIDRKRLLVMEHSTFTNELTHHQKAFECYIKQNKDIDTELRILVYADKNVLERHFPGVYSWNYAAYGENANSSEPGRPKKGKVFIHYPDNTIEILSAMRANAYLHPKTEGWQNSDNQMITSGLFVSGNIKDVHDLQSYSLYLSSGIKSPCPAPPTPSTTSHPASCWAHHLVGRAGCTLTTDAPTPATSQEPPMTATRRIIQFAAIVALALLSASCNNSEPKTTPSANRVVIAVNQYIHHPNLEAVLDGFKAVMSEAAGPEGWEVDYRLQVANGDVSTAGHIAAQQAAGRPALILALATPSAQASVKSTKSIPVVFGAITDPVAAGLVASMERPGGNATGSSDRWPTEKQVALIRTLMPEARSVGIPFNPGEANSVASMQLLRPAFAASGLQLREVAVSNTSELIPAIRSVIDRCDLLFAPADNTVLAGLDAVIKLARARQIPLFVGDEGSVRKGGVATYGIDYRALGEETGKIALRILQGESPGNIPVAVSAGARLVLNPAEAARQGLRFPDELIAAATLVEE